MEIRTELTARVPYFLVRTLYLTADSVLNARFEKNQIIVEVLTSKPNLPVNQSVKLHLDQAKWTRMGYEEGYQEGLNKGLEEGFYMGQKQSCEYQDGFIEGYEKGFDEGTIAGNREGYTTGYWKGYETGTNRSKPDIIWRQIKQESKPDAKEEVKDNENL